MIFGSFYNVNKHNKERESDKRGEGNRQLNQLNPSGEWLLERKDMMEVG